MITVTLQVDENLLQYCTPRQREILDAVIATGSGSAADTQVGVAPGTSSRCLKAVTVKAAKAGYAPQASNIAATVPEGFAVKRLSARFDKEGRPAGGWQISEPDKEKQAEYFQKFIAELCEQVRGLSPLVPNPYRVKDDLLSVYPIGDQHHGMYAEAEQTGAEYNTDISAKLLSTSVDYLCASAPYSGTALLLDVGDFHHANDSKNETPASGHAMHVTASYGKVMHTGAMALVHCVLRLLQKHENVVVWIMPGNHNPDAAFATAMALSFYFHNNPRVSVDLGTSAFKFLRFGNNLIASHHGDGAKAANLPLIMAVDRPKDWAETEYRVWHCGHIHHKTVKEEPGCDIETHRTLAPSNAWDHKKGYRSKREMQRIDYHRELGECNRQRCDLKMIGASNVDV